MKILVREYKSNTELESLVSDEVLRRVLAGRGVAKQEDLECALATMLHYRDLKNIDAATDLLADHLMAGHTLAIAGDYDVDGMTGTTLGVKALQALGAKRVIYHVPSRYQGGYGLSCEAVDYFLQQNASLIITVDNGISAFEAISYAKEHQLDVLVTDHHECQTTLPQANVIVDPKQEGCNFQSKNLSGVGVLFYVLIALRQKLVDRGFIQADTAVNMASFLDLVALGTLGDLVPLDTNNRRLVKAGLKRIQHGSSQVGLKALASYARNDIKKANSQTIVFDFCPRLNAATRLDLPENTALQCLMATTLSEAQEFARKLDYCNKRRTDYEKVMLAEAKELLLDSTLKHSVVLHKDSFLEGIVGLLANRLKEQEQKPTFIFAGDGDLLTGSGRSLCGISLAQVLENINLQDDTILERFGGHAMAAGATVKRENFERFAAAFDAQVAACAQQECEEQILTDGSLDSSYYNLDFVTKLDSLGPFGPGFEEPSFVDEFVLDGAFSVGQKHMRYRLFKDGVGLDAILFNASDPQKSLVKGMKVKAVYSLFINDYQNRHKVEARLSYLEPI